MSGPIETEIKLPLKGGIQAVRLLLEEQGYRAIAPRTHQVDQVYDFPDRALRQSGRLLRVRSESVGSGQGLPENTGAILTYKGPVLSADPHKSREELETSAADGPTLERILARLGLIPSFRYEKYRSTFQAEGEPGLVELDETPIGDFLELEGPGYWIDATALRLGFTAQDYIAASYAALYRDFLKANAGPSDMLFREEQ
jgi:adenylate cyclase class 2